MNETDYNARLYEKMKAEQDKYREWLLHQEPSEILNQMCIRDSFKEVLCSRCKNCSGHLRVFHGNQPCRKEKNQSTGPYDCFICIANYLCVDARILNSSIN